MGLVSFLAIGNETVVVETVRTIQTIGNPNGSVLHRATADAMQMDWPFSYATRVGGPLLS
jgi:hypothetical protein